MINYEVKFLTHHDVTNTKNLDLKVSKYSSLKKQEENVFDTGKRKYIEKRSGRSKPPRSRDLRELESKFFDQTVIQCEWTSQSSITIVFSSGIIGFLRVNVKTLDIEHISFDRFCVSKLNGHSITGVAFTNEHILFTHVESSATLITLGVTKVDQGLCVRLADRHPHVQTVDLADGARRADRRVSWSSINSPIKRTRVLVWTRGAGEPVPWSPEPEARADVHLYNITGFNINVIAYHKLENETLSVDISRLNFNIVHIVDQVNCRKNGVILEWSRYHVETEEEGVVRLGSHRAGATRVLLPGLARVVKRYYNDTRLLVACIDGSLHVVQQAAGVTHSVRAGFIASSLWCEWVLCVCGESRVRCYDAALTPTHNTDSCVPLHNYIRESSQMSVQACLQTDTGLVLLAKLAEGPLTLMKLTQPNLFTCRTGSKLTSSVNLLHAMDWDLEGDKCLYLLQKIVAEVFRRGLTAESEALGLSALGAYMARPEAPDKYRPHVIRIARKMFHHMLRRGRVDKCVSLAVDVSSWDLCVDARRAATAAERPHLAREARLLAAHYAQLQESNCSDSCSCTSSSSYTSSESERTKPPPLPRINAQQQPTIVPVQTQETYTTHSIRPNLHQYLDRDATIWNTEVKTNKVRWRSFDDILNDNAPNPIERRNKSIVNLASMNYNEDYRYNMARFSEKRERGEKSGRQTEKNVKFSDTVTVNVVSEPPPSCPVPSLELAASLPLCAPHAYLAAFSRNPDNVQKPPKIKVVHFGMV